MLQGTGSTLTTYVYTNSPSGEGGAPEKAYAAAFLLLVLVLVLNWAVDRIARGSREARMDPLMPPPPIRRIVVDAPHEPVAPPEPNGARADRARAARASATDGVERMRVDGLTIAYGGKVAVNDGHAAGPPGRGARR